MSTPGVDQKIYLPPHFRSNQQAEHLFSRIVEWSLANHPFYKRFYNDPENAIPLLTREEIQRHQEEFLNGHGITGRTSGSTGQPVHISWTPRRAMMEKQDSDEFFKHLGGTLPTARILSGAAHKAADNLLEVTLPVQEQVDFLVKQYLRNGAKAITTIPSNLESLCGFIIEEKLDFSYVERFGCIAELFEEHHEALIHQAFPKAVIWSSYSCSEVGVVAVRCPYNPRYHHIMSHKIGVEVLDDQGDPCAHGQQGRVILTDFMNTQAPFIRYDIADRAAYGACDCGRINLPALQDISGKQIGTFLLADGTRALFTQLKILLRDLPMIAQFQLIQESLLEFTVNFVLREGLSQDSLQSIVRGHFEAELGPGVLVNFVEKNAIERSAAGKLQVTSSRV